MQSQTILVTGSPGFIGANLVMKLLKNTQNCTIISMDNLNPYYDVSLKKYRLNEIEKVKDVSDSKHIFVKGDISDKAIVTGVFDEYHPDIVINLAAQAGVRYSIEAPDSYIKSNIVGFYNILEACRTYKIEHLIFASSSSVYGKNKKFPFSTEDMTDEPVSLYAATKKSDELLAYSYAALYQFPVTGLRFFTVYGPAGRPDMFYYSATEKFRRNEKVYLYNNGNCNRDFTYIDDIVEGICRVIAKPPKNQIPYAIYNIGCGRPVNLLDFINTLQEALISHGILQQGYDFDKYKVFVPMQPGDVPNTYADTSQFEKDFGFTPNTSVKEGLDKFAQWYKHFFG